jgi:transcriptional regulator with XRE-family HTH domain
MNGFFIDESGHKESQPALGRAIRALRERQEDLTPKALAERADVDVRLLEQIEAGEGGDFNTITYVRRALGVSAKEFAELCEGLVKEEEGA